MGAASAPRSEFRKSNYTPSEKPLRYENAEIIKIFSQKDAKDAKFFPPQRIRCGGKIVYISLRDLCDLLFKILISYVSLFF